MSVIGYKTMTRDITISNDNDFAFGRVNMETDAILLKEVIANGVAANRIRTISYGKDKPVVLGSNEEAWAKNRSATTVAY